MFCTATDIFYTIFLNVFIQNVLTHPDAVILSYNTYDPDLSPGTQLQKLYQLLSQTRIMPGPRTLSCSKDVSIYFSLYLAS